MYTKDGKIADRRELLKIKIKSLAEESRIIRFQEKRSHGQLREEMYRHRIDVVRREARLSLIAYAIIRGKDPKVGDPRLDELNLGLDKLVDGPVAAMVKKFGPMPVQLKAVA